MKESLTCITCPLGCRLEAERGEDGTLSVSGNRCPRGAAYAREELLAPKRVVTATCRIAAQSLARLPSAAPRRLPVKTSAAFPKERVPELLELIYGLEATTPVARGQVLAADLLGSGVDLVATRSVQ